MSIAAQYALALGVVFGVNLLPAFGPPTWLFALSPLPSGQLFVAAGLMTVPLAPLTAAFFTGRLVSYSIYVTAASVAERNLGAVAIDSLTSPLGMALQLAMLAGLAVLLGRSGDRMVKTGSQRVD